MAAALHTRVSGGRSPHLALSALALNLSLCSGASSLAPAAFAAPPPAGSPATPPVQAPPPIILSPQITVPPAAAPTVTVQLPPSDPLKTWLPVGVAVLSAMVAAFSAFLAWRNQRFTFKKDKAAVIRDIRAKQAAANLLAFENNVARSVGAVLDLVEAIITEVSKIRPVAATERPQQLEIRGISVMVDHARGERLCTEADGALHGSPPRVLFVSLFVRKGLDSLFVDAIGEAVAGPPGVKFDVLRQSIIELKIELRKILEQERQAEATRWIGEITDDPFYEEIKHLIRPPASPV